MRRMYRTLSIRLLLVLALLFAQMGGLTHGIAHTLAEQSQDHSLPHDKLCDLCASYAQLGNSLGSSHVHFTATAQCFTFQASHAADFHSVALSAFAARAPPYSA